jgi:hypothetical protein
VTATYRVESYLGSTATQFDGRITVRLGLPQDATDWISCEDVLTDPALLPTWSADLAAWLTATYEDAPEQTVAGYLLSWYLMIPGYAAGMLFHHERRVPSLRPDDLAFHLTSWRPKPDKVALLSPYFACLPDDPAAGTPEAVVVADEHALATVLRGRFGAHAKRFIEAFGPQARFGKRTLWAAATDVLDSALWHAGRYGGDEAGGVLDATLVLGDGHSPFTSASTLRHTGKSGAGEWTRRRESCCFHYLLKDGTGPCSTCPRLSARQTP